MMKTGRPSKYKKEYCDRLVEYMSRGKSYESFGAEVGVCDDTLREWEKKHPEFSAAKRLGRVRSLRWWEDLVQYGSQGLPCNMTGAIFVLKCRHRWAGYRDKFDDDPKDTQIIISQPQGSIDLSKESTENLVDKLLEAKKRRS